MPNKPSSKVNISPFDHYILHRNNQPALAFSKDNRMSARYCSIRWQPRKFEISFTVPDSVSAEINDKKRVVGKHPMRLTRIPSPSGGSEFRKLVVDAEKESPALSWKKRNGVVKKMNKKAYHGSRLNDWYAEVFYLESRLDQNSEPITFGFESDFDE